VTGNPDNQHFADIGLRRLALGALSLYALNFGGVLLLSIVIAFGIFIAGVLASQFGVVPSSNPLPGHTAFVVVVVLAVALLISATLVCYAFWWGVRSILRRRIISSSFFLLGLLVLHVAWARLFGVHIAPINWFSAAIAASCIALLVIRRNSPS
jgi:hypothetical protein